MESLIYFIVWAAIIFLVMHISSGSHIMGTGQHKEGKEGRQTNGATRQWRWEPPEQDTDPVCGKTVSPERAKPSVYDGYVYYFCSRECREVFEAAPETYVGPNALKTKTEMEHAHV